MLTDNTRLISIDLETLGKQKPRAAIATIGMVAVDIGTGQEAAAFYARVERSSALRVGQADQDTLDWWSRQPDAARAEIEQGDTPLRTALLSLAEAIKFATDGRDPSDVAFVARAPSFDLAILDYHYSCYGLETPWQYWQERDHRSIEDAWCEAIRLGGGECLSYRDATVVEHHALEDARWQALYLLNLRDALRRICVPADERLRQAARKMLDHDGGADSKDYDAGKFMLARTTVRVLVGKGDEA